MCAMGHVWGSTPGSCGFASSSISVLVLLVSVQKVAMFSSSAGEKLMVEEGTCLLELSLRRGINANMSQTSTHLLVMK